MRGLQEISKSSLVLAVMAGCLAMPFQASKAQSTNSRCDTVPEMIATLRPSTIGAYNLWDNIYGEIDKTEIYVSGVQNKDSGNVVAAGMRYAGARGALSLLLVEIDRRGRPVWQHEYKIKGLRDVKKIMAMPEGYAVLGTVGDGAAQGWVGFYDVGGKQKGEADIAVDGAALEAVNLTPGYDNDIVVLAQVTPGSAQKQAAPYSMFFWVNADGTIRQQRSYMMGGESRINALIPQGEEFYMAAGFLRGEDGRKAGWLMRLNAQGGIIWQREYPRGRAGEFVDAATFGEQYVTAVGRAIPGGAAGKDAGWVMMANINTTEIAWQRYYRDDYDMAGFAVDALSDGQVIVAMNGDHGQKPLPENEDDNDDKNNKDDKPQEPEKLPDYVRLLTINPRGVILQSQSYFSGDGVQGGDMFIGNKNEPVLIGYTDMTYRIEKKNPPPGEPAFDEKKGREGWALAGAPTEAYVDPCAQPYRFTP